MGGETVVIRLKASSALAMLQNVEITGNSCLISREETLLRLFTSSERRTYHGVTLLPDMHIKQVVGVF
jgi:hypothetical protein